MRAAPRLRVVETPVTVSTCEEAMLLLRKEGVFAALCVDAFEYDAVEEEDFNDLRDLAAAVGQQTSLHCLCFRRAVGLAVVDVIDALGDAALALPLETLVISECGLEPECVPALARVLTSTSLRELEITNDNPNDGEAVHLFDGPSAQLFSAALCSNSTLRVLCLARVTVWEDNYAAVAVLAAVAAHRTLLVLRLSHNSVPDDAQGFAGSLLAAVLAADTLQELGLDNNNLRDEALRIIARSLPRATHLRTLDLSDGNDFSDDCVRDVLLPAARAAASLRELLLEDSCDAGAADDVERVLEARRDAS